MSKELFVCLFVCLFVVVVGGGGGGGGGVCVRPYACVCVRACACVCNETRFGERKKIVIASLCSVTSA